MLVLDIKLIYNNFTLNCQQQLSLDGITGIVGHSGSGKTTLLRIISGLNSQASGVITLAERELQNTQHKYFMPAEQRQVGFVFQDARLFPHLTVLGNLQFAAKRCANKTLSIDEVIVLTQLSPLVSRQTNGLSAGEKQRVALARAILAEPKLLLLDEPLSALDIKARQHMVAMLQAIHQQLKLPMLYVTHNVEEVQQLANHLMIMAHGQIKQYGPIHQILNNIDHDTLGPVQLQTSLTVKIHQHHHDFGLTEVGIISEQSDGAQRLYLPLQRGQVGSNMRCYILASDVSLSLTEPTASSIVNCLAGKIVTIIPLDNTAILIKVDCGRQIFNVRISRYSHMKLMLSEQQHVFIQCKASAVRRL
jgi:molybdate transport system ATP-binding protein